MDDDKKAKFSVKLGTGKKRMRKGLEDHNHGSREGERNADRV